MFKQPSLPTPTLPTPPNAPAQMAPAAQKPQRKSSQPTFIGSADQSNPTNTGNKALIGGGA